MDIYKNVIIDDFISAKCDGTFSVIAVQSKTLFNIISEFKSMFDEIPEDASMELSLISEDKLIYLNNTDYIHPPKTIDTFIDSLCESLDYDISSLDVNPTLLIKAIKEKREDILCEITHILWRTRIFLCDEGISELYETDFYESIRNNLAEGDDSVEEIEDEEVDECINDTYQAAVEIQLSYDSKEEQYSIDVDLY